MNPVSSTGISVRIARHAGNDIAEHVVAAAVRLLGRAAQQPPTRPGAPHRRLACPASTRPFFRSWHTTSPGINHCYMWDADFGPAFINVRLLHRCTGCRQTTASAGRQNTASAGRTRGDRPRPQDPCHTRGPFAPPSTAAATAASSSTSSASTLGSGTTSKTAARCGSKTHNRRGRGSGYGAAPRRPGIRRPGRREAH